MSGRVCPEKYTFLPVQKKKDETKPPTDTEDSGIWQDEFYFTTAEKKLSLSKSCLFVKETDNS